MLFTKDSNQKKAAWAYLAGDLDFPITCYNKYYYIEHSEYY